MHFPISGVDVFPLVPPLVAFCISFFTSMGGVSGAFLLLPFQVSVLGFTSPSVSPTNMIYNIVAIPSGVYRYMREGRMAWPLAGVIITGTLPGLIIGVYLRLTFLPDPEKFKLFIGCVLLYVGMQLFFRNRKKESNQVVPFNAAGKNPSGNPESDADTADKAVVRTIHFSLKRYEYEFWGEQFSFNTMSLGMLALIVGIIGGAYGMGGGAIIAPFCVALFRLPVYTVAGAALLGTFVSSVFGVLYYSLAEYIVGDPSFSIQPDWLLGALFGVGGFAGMYCGARLQKRVPEKVIKTVLGSLITFLALQYIIQYFV